MPPLLRCYSHQCCTSPFGTEASSKGNVIKFCVLVDSGRAHVFKTRF